MALGNQVPATEAPASQNDQTFVQLENRVSRLENEINSKIVYFTQLSALFESIDPAALIESHSKIIGFCQLIMDKMTVQMAQEVEGGEDELVHLIFSVVSVFTTGLVELETDVKESLRAFQPLLVRFKSVSCAQMLCFWMFSKSTVFVTFFRKVKDTNIHSESVLKLVMNKNYKKAKLMKLLNFKRFY